MVFTSVRLILQVYESQYCRMCLFNIFIAIAGVVSAMLWEIALS